MAAAAKAVLHDIPMEVDTAPGYSSQGGRGRGRGGRAAVRGRGRATGYATRSREDPEEQAGPAWPASQAEFG